MDRVSKFIEERFFKDKNYKGVFIDVGAASPIELSSSEVFRKRGWKIVRVEPNPKFIKQHQQAGLKIEPYAAAHYNADNVPFEISGINRDYSFSTLAENRNYDSEKPKDYNPTIVNVNVRTLDWILETNYPEIFKIDILAIDTEGYELEVLKGINIEKYKPTVIVSEDFLHLHKATKYLEEKGYEFSGISGCDYFYKRQDC